MIVELCCFGSAGNSRFSKEDADHLYEKLRETPYLSLPEGVYRVDAIHRLERIGDSSGYLYLTIQADSSAEVDLLDALFASNDRFAHLADAVRRQLLLFDPLLALQSTIEGELPTGIILSVDQQGTNVARMKLNDEQAGTSVELRLELLQGLPFPGKLPCLIDHEISTSDLSSA